jgi:hypothetical protein
MRREGERVVVVGVNERVGRKGRGPDLLLLPLLSLSLSLSLTLKNLTTSATVPVMPSMFSSAVLGTW